MWSATPATQCTLCWQFGHPAAGCPKGPSNAQCCRICGDTAHTARAHPCPQCLAEPAMPKKIDGVCPHASPKCINCGTDHPANSPSCPKRVEALAEQRARANKLVLHPYKGHHLSLGNTRLGLAQKHPCTSCGGSGISRSIRHSAATSWKPPESGGFHINQIRWRHAKRHLTERGKAEGRRPSAIPHLSKSHLPY